jgi:hypothetical protein
MPPHARAAAAARGHRFAAYPRCSADSVVGAGIGMGCYLRVWGEAFDVDAFLADTALVWDPVWHRGERKRIAFRDDPREHQDSGVTTRVSAAEDVDEQVADALAFLRSEADEIKRLLSMPGVTSAYLDFGVFWRLNSAAQFSRFPAELLSRAGGLGMWLEVSYYATGGDEEPPDEQE